MNIKLRNFQFPDLNSIVKIENASFSVDAYPKKRFEKLWRLHSKDFIVAKLRDKIIGYIIAYPKRYFIDFDSLAIDKKYRKLGIGRKLVNFMLNRFKKKGLKRALLEVKTTNKTAIAFYQKLGFKIKKTLKGYYRDKANAYQMEKIL